MVGNGMVVWVRIASTVFRRQYSGAHAWRRSNYTLLLIRAAKPNCGLSIAFVASSQNTIDIAANFRYALLRSWAYGALRGRHPCATVTLRACNAFPFILAVRACAYALLWLT